MTTFEHIVNILDGGKVSDHAEVSFDGTHLHEQEVMGGMPREVQLRVRALKKNQLDIIELQKQFQQRYFDLEKEFEEECSAVFRKRKAIVSGKYEPSDDECDAPLVHGLTPEELQKLEDDAPVDETSQGVPNFWLNVLKNSVVVGLQIQERDIPVLEFLTDIKSELHTDPNGFSLHFHFSHNPYFKNSVLTKDYLIDTHANGDNPFENNFPVVVKGQGTAISWRKGMDVTEKVDENTEPSFFEFFSVTPKEIVGLDDPQKFMESQMDFETGQVILNEIVPRAVLYFTGEAGLDDCVKAMDLRAAAFLTAMTQK